MTTLAKDTPRAYELEDFSDCPMVATDVIYEGAAVGDNGAGYARPLQAGDQFLGFAKNQADNSTGSAGDITVHVQQEGKVQLSISALAITDVGKPVYASDDATFTLTSTGNSFIGRVARWVSTGIGIVAFDVDCRSGIIGALTDNSGGSANSTLTAVGGLVTLTDNTGDSATHDDTLADGLTSTAFTADNGGGTADGTVEVVTVPTGITDGTMAGTADGAFETIGSTSGGDVSAAIMNNFKEVQAYMTANGTALTAVKNDLKECTTKIASLITDVTVQNQNDSDLAQKVIEVVADLEDVKNNFADLAAKVNALIQILS